MWFIAVMGMVGEITSYPLLVGAPKQMAAIEATIVPIESQAGSWCVKGRDVKVTMESTMCCA